MATAQEIAVAYVSIVPSMRGVQGAIAREMGGANSALSKAGNTAGGAWGRTFQAGIKAATAVATTVVATGAAAMGVALTKGLGRLNAIDTAKAKLRGLGMDANMVSSIMKNATASVKGTAFGLDEAATTAAGAVAAGIVPGKQLESTLKTVSNVAAASGRTMAETGDIFNQVAAGGKAYTMQIKQLANAGLPIWQKLAEQLGVTTDEVQKLASSGQIDFATFEAAAKAAAGTVAVEMGTTLPGAMSNAMAAVSRFGANLWKGFENDDGSYTGVYSKLTDLVIAFQNAMGPIEEIGAKIGNAVGEKVGPILDKLTGLLNRFGDAGDSAGKKFAPLMNALGPAAAMFGMLGVKGLAPLLTKLPLVGPMLGGVSGGLSKIAGPAGIAAAGLFALTKVDPTQMTAGFVEISGKLPGIFADMTDTITKVALELLPAMRTAILDNLPVLIEGVTHIIQVVGVQLGQMLPVVVEAGVALFGGLVHAITQVLPQLITSLVGLVQTLLPVLVQQVPVLLNGAIQLFMGLVQALAQVIPPLLQGIVDMVPMILEALVSLVPMLIEGAIQLFMGLVQALGEIIPPLLQAVVDLIPMIVDALVSMLPMLIEGALTLLMGLVQAAIDIVPPLIEQIVTLVPTVVESLVGMLPALIDGAVQLFMGIVDAITLIIPPLLEMLPTLVTNIVETLVTLLPILLDGAVQLFMGLVEAITVIIPSLIDTVISLIPMIVDTILGLVPILLDGAIQLFTALMDAIPIIIPPLLTAIIEMIPVIVNALIELVPELINAGIELWTGLIDAIPQVLPDLIQAAVDMIPELVTALVTEGVPALLQAGKDILGGLVSGIGDMAGGAVDAIKGVGSSMVSGFKGLLGISSPSKVFAQIGGFLDKGLADGVGQGTGSVDAVKKMASAITAITAGLQKDITRLSNVIAQQVAKIITSLRSLVSMMSGTFKTQVAGQLNAVAQLFRTVLPNAVTAAMKSMRSQMQAFQTWFGGSFRNGIVTAVKAIQSAFTSMPSAVNTAWGKIKAGTATPTNYVIGTVYMAGIRAATNAINSAVGLPARMPAVNRIGYAAGGVLPGYTPGRDVYDFYSPQFGTLRLSGGEGILRPEVVKALGGAATINAWNQSRGQGISRVGDRGYASGGILDFLKKTPLGWSVNTGKSGFQDAILDQPRLGYDALVTDPAKQFAARAGGGSFGVSAGKSFTDIAGTYAAIFAKQASALGNTALVAAARKALGVPYLWGGSSVPPGLDCSGLVYWAFQQMGKNAPRLTAAGYQSAATPTSSPRAGDLAFWGNPASHVAIMTGANSIVHAPRPGTYVTNAALYGNPTFGRLKYDEGGYLPPGLTLVENRTGKPEPVFTSDQWDRMQGGGVVYNDNRRIYNPVAEPDSIRVAKNLQRAGAKVGALA